MKKFETPKIEVINLDEEVLTTIGGQSNNPVDTCPSFTFG